MDKISVILVDDNRLSFEYMLSLLNWKEMGFKVVGTAIDGEQGFKLYKKYRPQIVITDIDMPIMNGVELARLIKQENEDAVILFLSHYDEFDYARSALELGIDEYILKHELDTVSLTEKLDKAKKRIKKIQDRKTHEFEEQLKDVFLNEQPFPDEWRNSSQKYFSLFIEVDHPLDIFDKVFGEVGERPKWNENILRQICFEIHTQIACCIRLDKYLYLVTLDSREMTYDQIIGISYRTKNALEAQFGGTFSVYASAQASRLLEYKEVIKDGKEQIKMRYFTFPSSIISPQFFSKKKKVQLTERSQIETLLLQGEAAGLMMMIDRIYNRVLSDRDYKGLSAQTEIFLEIIKPYHESIIAYKTGKVFYAYQKDDAVQWYSAADAVLWVKNKYNQLLEIFSDNKTAGYSGYAKDAIKYIYKNYADCELSVELVAENIGISLNHLNSIFKSETKMTVHNFLTNVRMEQAKNFLKDSSMKINEVSVLSGYANIQYFSKVFKKHVGMTPMEYRSKRVWEI